MISTDLWSNINPNPAHPNPPPNKTSTISRTYREKPSYLVVQIGPTSKTELNWAKPAAPIGVAPQRVAPTRVRKAPPPPPFPEVGTICPHFGYPPVVRK